MSDNKLVTVLWEDTTDRDNVWTSIEEIEEWLKEKTVVNQVGWIIAENRDRIILSSQIIPHMECHEEGKTMVVVGNGTRIPKANIISLTYVSPLEGERPLIVSPSAEIEEGVGL